MFVIFAQFYFVLFLFFFSLCCSLLLCLLVLLFLCFYFDMFSCVFFFVCFVCFCVVLVCFLCLILLCFFVISFVESVVYQEGFGAELLRQNCAGSVCVCTASAAMRVCECITFPSCVLACWLKCQFGFVPPPPEHIWAGQIIMEAVSL